MTYVPGGVNGSTCISMTYTSIVYGYGRVENIIAFKRTADVDVMSNDVSHVGYVIAQTKRSVVQ